MTGNAALVNLPSVRRTARGAAGHQHGLADTTRASGARLQGALTGC